MLVITESHLDFNMAFLPKSKVSIEDGKCIGNPYYELCYVMVLFAIKPSFVDVSPGSGGEKYKYIMEDYRDVS